MFDTVALEKPQNLNLFSALVGISMTLLATQGCVNPPTVRYVDGMAKLASPLTTVNKCKHLLY